MKRLFFLMLFFVTCVRLTAQEPVYSPLFPVVQVPNTGKSDPKFADQIYSVDLYHGTADVEIPIYNYELDGLNLGVSLTYRCKGILVDQLASTIGLGWNLKAGFAMERQLEGTEDEYSLPPLYGYEPPYPLHNTPMFMPPIKGKKVHSSLATSQVHDQGYDLFHISLPGRNLTAHLSYNAGHGTGKLVTFPKAELDVEVILSHCSYPGGVREDKHSHPINPHFSEGKLMGDGLKEEDSLNYLRFNIIDEQGNRYVFERGDYEYKMHSFKEWKLMRDSSVYYPPTNWKIKEIVTLSGLKVKYHYKRIDNIDYPLYKDEKIGERFDHIDIIRNDIVYWKGSITVVTMIEYPDGTKVYFNYEDNPDKMRWDAGGQPALKTITVEKGYDNHVKNTLTYRFLYSYFHAKTSYGIHPEIPYGLDYNSTRNWIGYDPLRDPDEPRRRMKTALRLKLNGVDRVSYNNIAERYYSFEYNTTPLPPRLSPRRDFFGYYNGKEPVSSSVIYKDKYGDYKQALLFNLAVPLHYSFAKGDNNHVVPYVYGMDRSHSLHYMKAAILESVKNSYAGVVRFFYKDHVLINNDKIFKNYRGQNVDYALVGATAREANDGVCISHISHHDGYNNGNEYNITYCYEGGERFFGGGFMWYNGKGLKRDYTMSSAGIGAGPYWDYVFWHNHSISKHMYHDGYNHGYSFVEVIKSGANNNELLREQYEFSNLSGPLFNRNIYGAAFPNTRVELFDRWSKQQNAYVPHHLYLHNLGNLMAKRTFYPGTQLEKDVSTYKYSYSRSTLNIDFEISSTHSYMGGKMNVGYTQLFSARQNISQSKTVKKVSIFGTQERESLFSYMYDTFDNVSVVKWKDSKGNLLSRKFTYSYDIPHYGYGGFGSQHQYLITTTTVKGSGSGAQIVRVEENSQLLPLGRYSQFRSMKATAPVPDGTSPPIAEDKRYTVKDDHANVVETQYDGLDRYSSNIWDTRIGKKVAEVTNARYVQIAYTSFEGPVNGYGTVPADPNKGNWEYYPEDVKHRSMVSRVPVTGNYLLQINKESTHRIESRYSLETGGKYLLSFWANMLPQVQLIPDGAGANSTITPELVRSSPDGWSLYQAVFDITQVKRRVRITNSHPSTALQLDELRLHPVDAGMVTTTYEPLWGPNAVCDERHDITYYEYDAFGRLTLVRDIDGNIITKTTEVVQGADN